MKIAGKKPALDTRPIVFQRRNGQPIGFTLTALPIGTDDRYNRELRHPVPPFKDYAREPKTGEFLYDRDGRLIHTYDVQDPKYREARRRRNRLWTVCMVVEALANDPNVEFESKRENFKTTEEWAEALYREFCESGLAMGELNDLIDAVMTLSGLRTDEMERARADFSQRGASAPGGGSPTTPDEPKPTGNTESGSDSA